MPIGAGSATKVFAAMRASAALSRHVPRFTWAAIGSGGAESPGAGRGSCREDIGEPLHERKSMHHTAAVTVGLQEQKS
jgi:hypothetical protein